MIYKNALLTLTAGIGGVVAAVGAAAQAIPIPADIVPSAHTSFEGFLAMVAVAMFRTISTKKDSEAITKQLSDQDAKMIKIENGLISSIDGLKDSITEERVSLAEWMGGVSKSIEHHGELIAGVAEKVENLRIQAA